MSLITAEQLRAALHFDPETGIFTWIKRRPGKRIADGIAGNLVKSGYWTIMIDGRNYRAHRLAWLYVHGVWPKNDIDHKDRNRSNNILSNLREADRPSNIINSKTRSDNTSGIRGVSWNAARCKWCAEISLHKKRVYLGGFDTVEEAQAAYEKAASEHYGDFASVA